MNIHSWYMLLPWKMYHHSPQLILNLHGWSGRQNQPSLGYNKQSLPNNFSLSRYSKEYLKIFGILESVVVIFSVTPSVKGSCPGSPLMFTNGSTAMEGLSRRGNVIFLLEVSSIGGLGCRYKRQIAT